MTALRYLAVFCLAISICSCSEKPEKKILGRWAQDQTVPAENIEGGIALRGITEYFSNRMSNFEGQMTWRQPVQGGATAEFSFFIQASSEWKVDEKKLVIKQIDTKVRPAYFLIDGSRNTDPLREQRFAEMAKTLSEATPHGKTSEAKIISLDKDQMILEEEVGGKLENRIYKRTEKSFSEYRKTLKP